MVKYSIGLHQQMEQDCSVVALHCTDECLPESGVGTVEMRTLVQRLTITEPLRPLEIVGND